MVLIEIPIGKKYIMKLKNALLQERLGSFGILMYWNILKKVLFWNAIFCL